MVMQICAFSNSLTGGKMSKSTKKTTSKPKPSTSRKVKTAPKKKSTKKSILFSMNCERRIAQMVKAPCFSNLLN